jgi:hypothetical protein
MATTRKLYRSAKDGRFVPKAQVMRSPATTVTETVRAKKRKKS